MRNGLVLLYAAICVFAASSGISSAEGSLLTRSKGAYTVTRGDQSVTVPADTDFLLRSGDLVETAEHPVQASTSNNTHLAMNKQSALKIVGDDRFELLTGQLAVMHQQQAPVGVDYDTLQIQSEALATSASPASTNVQVKPVSSVKEPQSIMLFDAISPAELQVYSMGQNMVVTAEDLASRVATVPTGDYVRMAKNAGTGAWEVVDNIPNFLSEVTTSNTSRTIEVVDDRRFGLFWWEGGAVVGGAALIGGTALLLNNDDDNDDDDDDDRRFNTSPFFFF
jgi:hypothetical protein